MNWFVFFFTTLDDLNIVRHVIFDDTELFDSKLGRQNQIIVVIWLFIWNGVLNSSVSTDSLKANSGSVFNGHQNLSELRHFSKFLGTNLSCFGFQTNLLFHNLLVILVKSGSIVVQFHDFSRFFLDVFGIGVFHVFELVFQVVTIFSQFFIFFDQNLISADDGIGVCEFFLMLFLNLFQKLLVLFNSLLFSVYSVGHLFKLNKFLSFVGNFNISLIRKRFLSINLFFSLLFLLFIVLKKNGKLDHTFLNFEILLSKILLCLSELQLSLLGLLLLILVFFLLLIHLSSLLQESSGWTNCI